MPAQFDNPANVEVHKRTTAIEVFEATEGRLDAFVAGVGTGGSVTGHRDRSQGEDPGNQDRRGGVRRLPRPLGRQAAARTASRASARASSRRSTTRRSSTRSSSSPTRPRSRSPAGSAARKAIFVGISAGAVCQAALQVAKELGPNKRVVALLPDLGERYLSHELFDRASTRRTGSSTRRRRTCRRRRRPRLRRRPARSEGRSIHDVPPPYDVGTSVLPSPQRVDARPARSAGRLSTRTRPAPRARAALCRERGPRTSVARTKTSEPVSQELNSQARDGGASDTVRTRPRTGSLRLSVRHDRRELRSPAAASGRLRSPPGAGARREPCGPAAHERRGTRSSRLKPAVRRSERRDKRRPT